MTVTRSPPRGNVDEMHASHEVMELVRSNSVLSLMVVQMREAGLSWRGMKSVIEAEIARRDPQADRHKATGASLGAQTWCQPARRRTCSRRPLRSLKH